MKQLNWKCLRKYRTPFTTLHTIPKYPPPNHKYDIQVVRDHDNKGVHTTTYREMILLPNGGLVIDTPGLREIQMWTDTEGVTRTFRDIEDLAEKCRFNDCLHGDEPGCAIQEAIENDDLDDKRLESYLKLQRELQHLSLRKDRKARSQAGRARAKKIYQILKGKEELRKKGLL